MAIVNINVLKSPLTFSLFQKIMQYLDNLFDFVQGESPASSFIRKFLKPKLTIVVQPQCDGGYSYTFQSKQILTDKYT